MAFKGTLVFFLTCQLNICCVMAAECTTAIIASVFGTIGSLVVIALVAVAIWYYCKQRQSASLSSTSSADSVSDPGFSFGGKTKGGQIGLDGNGTPMTFSDHYSEKAPSVAYNTSGVVNPAFSHSRDVVLDIPPGDDGEVKIDMDGGASIKPPDYNKNVNIGGEGESRIRKPSGSSDVKLDMDWDSRHDDVLPSTSGHALDLPGIKPPGSGSGLQGADVDVTVMGASYPKYDDGAVGEIGLETREVFLERPGRGGFGLLIARDKTLPPPALFIREVTPGGIAAKTGFVDKGDKIIGINGVSIEGMPHEKAMELLRDDTRPLLNLRLSKNAMNMEKGGFLDVPGGSIEESCSVDAAPSVEASPPTVQFETVQGDAPTLGQMGLTVTEPNVGTTKAPLDLSEGNLDMRVSGPNGLSSTDIRGPSVGVANLPSKRKKSAKCLSCTSSGDVDEPYGKRSGKQEINLDGSDVTISGKGKMTDFESNGSDVNNAEKPKTDLEVNSSRPERYLSNDGMHSLSAGVDKPSNNKKIGNCFSCVGGTKHEEPYRKRRGKPDLDIDENSGSIELKTGQKFDLSGSGPNIPGTESEVKTRKLGFGASSSASDLDVEDSNLDIKASKPDVELDVNAPDITSPKAKSDVDYSTGNVRDLKEPSAQLNLPPSKRKHSNCFTCSGIGDKDEPYRKSQGNTGYALDGSKFDAAMEMKDVSGPTIGTSRADSDAPDAEIKASMAAHDVGLSTGQPRKQEKKGNEPSADLGLRSSNKKRENCFSCAGGVEKDEPYTTTRGETSFHLNEPDVDESIHPSGSNADISGPNVDNQGLKINVDKPDLEIDEQNLDLPKPQVNMHGEKPRVQGFKTDASGPGSYFSGSNVDTSAGMSGLEFDISENKPVVANGEDMEISARESTAAVNANLPEIDAHGEMIKADYPLEMGPPSVKKRRAKCFSCVGGVEKDEPYKTTRGQTTLDFNGSEVDGSIRPRAIHSGVSVPKGDTSQLRMKATQPDFEINQLNTDLSGPHIDIRGPNSGVSKPDFDVNRPSLDISAGTSGPELDIPGSRPIDENGEELDFVTGPPKAAVNANLDAPKASTKTEFLGLDFESPAGQLRGSKATVDRPSAEFGLPSRKKMGANCFSCTGGAEKDEPYKTAKGQTSFDLKGPELDGSMRPVDIDAGVSEPEVSAIGPKMTVAKSDNEIDQLNADFSVPGIGKQRPHNGVSELDFDGSQPDLDFSLEKSGPNLNIVNNREDFEISGSRPEAALNAKLPEIDQPEARVKTDFSGPDLDFPAGQSQGQKGTVHEPSAQLGVPSLKRKRANCFSCAGSAEKDEPYKTATGQTTFDLRGPDVRESVQPITVRPGVSGPNVNVEGGLNVNAAKPDFEIDQGKSDLAGPQIDVEEPNFDALGPKTFVTGPEVDVAGSNVDLPARISGPEYDIPEKKPVSANGDNLKISAREPRAAVNANLPEIDAPEASIEADYSATDFDLPSGPLKGPKPTVKKQSAELVFPSTKKKRANCFSCAGGAEKDEPYKTTREQTAFDLNGPEIDGSIQPTAVHSGISGPKGDANALKKVDIVKPDFESDSPNPAFSGPGVDIRGPNNDISRPDLGVSEPNLDISAGALEAGLGSQPAVKNGGELEISTRRPKADLDANLPEIDAPEGRIKTDFSGPGFDSSAGKFRSQNEAVHKPPAEFGLPSTKKKRANCFSCAGGAEKDEPYKTTRGQTAFDLNGPEVDGSMQPTTVLSGVSGPKGDVTGLKIDISKPDFESDSPNPAFSGPGVDIRGPNNGISRPDFGVSEPNLDISAEALEAGLGSQPAVKNGEELEISTRRPKADLDANLPEIDAPEGRIKTDFSGPGFDSSAGKFRSQNETVHKPPAEFGLPSTKKKRANCFSCAGGAEKDEPYKTTRGQTAFDLNGPEVDGSMQPTTVLSGVSGPKDDATGLKIDIAKPDFESNRPNPAFSGPGDDIRGPNIGISRPDVFISEPNLDISAGPSGEGQESTPAVKNGGELEISTRRPKAYLDANLPEIDAPEASINTDFSGPGFDSSAGKHRSQKETVHKLSTELGLPSTKKRGANCFSCAGGADKDEPYKTAKRETGFDIKGPEFNGFKQPGAMSVGMNNPKVDSEIEELSSDFSGPDVDADVPRFRGSNPDLTQLKIRETGAGVSASYSSGTKMDVSEPNIDVQVPKIGFDEVDNNVNGAGPKVSGREFDFAGPKYMQAGKADVRLDASVRTPKGKSLTKMSAPDDPDGEVRDPKASADMAAAELSPPSGTVKGANCFSCAGSLDKDEPYRKTKGKYEFSLQGPYAGMEESSFVAGTFPSTSGGTNLHPPTFESTPSKIELPSGSTELDLKTHQLDFPKDVENGTIEVRGPTFSHKSPEIPGASTGKDEIEFGTWRQDTDTHISLGEADWGFSNLNILGPKETIDLDFNLPDTDLPALKPSVDETKFDNDAPKAQFNANMPDIGVSTKKTNVECGIDELDNNVRGPDPDLSGLDVPTTRPSLAVNRSDMDIPDIPVGDLSYEANMPHLNSSGKEIDIGLNLDGLEKERSNGRLDIDANPPGVSIPERKSSLQVKGLDMEKTDLDYDLDISEGKAPFDWKLNKSTTNFTGPDTTLELDTEPLDGKIITANDSNLQLQSTPEPRPFVDYQEPRSLQRYDEIRPDMELRLMSPSPSEKPVFSSDLDSRMDTENSGKRMSLIKVEENIVLCSASLKEDDTRMQKRTLTLDREINQKIEIEFPEGKGFNEKGKSSTSSSSSTSSDSDSGTEDKPKKKKKFRLFKAFRKGSTSSTSSKGGETKEKGKGRKSSTSSSSSVDNKKNAKDPLRNYALSGKVTGKENADLFSSLEDPKVVCHKDLPKIENSGRSPSDSVQYNDEKKGQDLPAAEVTMRSTELPETNITLDPHTLHTPSLLVSNLVMDQEDFPETKDLNRSSSSSNSSDGGEHNDEEKAQDLPAPKLKFMSSTQLPQKDISFEAGTALNPSVQGKLDEVHESRISTSSSSSDEESDKMSDAEVDKEKSKRKKKKWRLFKSLRKDSTSSESSKEDGTETKQHESKKASSTSSSSSSDENERKEDQVRKNFHFVTPINNDLGDSRSSYGVSEPVKYNLEHIAIPTTYFASAEKKEPEQVPTGIPTVLSFTVNQETELKQQESSGSSSSDEEAPELSVENSKASMLYQVEYLNNHQKYIIEPHEDFAGPAAHYQEDGAGMGVPSVESRYPGSLNRGQTERKSSTSSSSSSDKEVSERKHSPSTHDNRPSSQATVDEHPVIVVYRSFKRPEFDNVGTTIDDHHEQQNVDIQHSELQDEGPYHLEYPLKNPSNEKVSDYHVKEDDITPVVKFKPNISVEIAPQDNANVDGGGREDFVSTTKEGHASPTWDLKSHTYQTVYHVTPPEKPVIHGESFEIPEVMPTVVRRSTKRILHDDDQEEDCPFVSINMDVELSEAANDFQLEYPETNDVFATNEKVSDNHVQQDDITPVVKFKPNISVEIAPHDNAKVDGGNREDFVSTAKEGHASPTWDLKSHSYETVYHVTAPEKPDVIHGESFEIPEVMPTVVQRSTKRILHDDDQEEDCPFVSINMDAELSEAANDFQLEYPETNDVFATNEKVSDNHVQQDDITPVVKFKPNISVEIAPHDNAKVDGGNREDFVSTAKEGHASPTWDLKSHTYQTVYHVTAPEKPDVIHGESFEIPEVMPTVVRRSTKRILHDDDQEEDCPFVAINMDAELSEAANDFQLEYPETNDVFTTNEKVSDNHVQQDDITPVVKFKPNISVEIAPHEIAKVDGGNREDFVSSAKEGHASPTWDLKSHTFETVYNVTAPEKPVIHGESFEIPEVMPTVVQRSTKRILYDDDQEEDCPFVSINTAVELSEATHDFQLEYPETNDVFTTNAHALKMTDDEWIVSHAFEKDKPDITALKASFDQPKEERRPRTNSTRSEDDKATTPTENSYNDSTRRRSNSNSRLWELMQGYLIETPVMDDDENETDSEKTEEPKAKEIVHEEKVHEEKDNSESKLERTVFHVSLKPTKFETVSVPVQISDLNEPTNDNITPTFESDASQVKARNLEFHNDDDDPWMRHYSKGLQKGQQYSSSAKSPEKELSSTQNRGLSLSKVPHVKELRPSARKDRPSYSSESRIQTGQVVFRVGTEKSQDEKSNQEPGRASVSSLRSFWDK
ncbi:neuroblast differentiation-associated protein AHNAK-like [Montipora capricornis]|uniref:neuroblast differentiation-associated protein AHNAK-like n=1 Tax=Montipora capricornis TaxID=246305 RepID=UPI0035F14AFF